MGYYIRVGVAVVVLPGTGAVLAHVGINPNSDPLKNWVKVLAVFWALAPPVWFLGEWYCFEGSTKSRSCKGCMVRDSPRLGCDVRIYSRKIIIL
jgi:hypothetical protein